MRCTRKINKLENSSKLTRTDYRPFQVVLVVKNPPAKAGDIEMSVESLGIQGWGDPLEKCMATHSRILA